MLRLGMITGSRRATFQLVTCRYCVAEGDKRQLPLVIVFEAYQAGRTTFKPFWFAYEDGEESANTFVTGQPDCALYVAHSTSLRLSSERPGCPR
jgi:hypothetical protein